MIFGKICSRLGRPIHMDNLTTHRGRVTFARCLVEIDMAEELIHSVTLQMPEGGEHDQMIYYENLPRYCPQCKVMGHTKDNCKRKLTNSNKAANTEQPGQITAEGKKGHQEWVIKQANTSTNIPAVVETDIPTIVEAVQVPAVVETAVVEPVHIPDKPIILESIPEIPENGVILALPNKDTSMQPPTIPVQLGGDIYVEQANQIASKELRNMLQQVSKVQKGSSTVGGTKKGLV